MADTVQATGELDPAGAEKQTRKAGEVEYAPGVLACVEAPPEKPLEFDDNEIAAIKSLNAKIAARDMPSRREQIVRVWEARLFDRGIQHLLPRQNGGWEIPSVGSGYGPGENDDRSQWEIDIYSSYRKIICAALTREVPGQNFDPVDQDDDVDITSASSANKLADKIKRDNKMKELQGECARFLWTDGLSVHFSRYVLDAQMFGYEPEEPDDDVPENEETGEAATELHANAEGDEGAGGDGAEGVDADDAAADGENSGEDEADSAENSADDNSGADESENESEDAGAGSPETRTPRGHELITVGGALEWKFPIKANSRAQCSYARYSFEVDQSTAKAAYPEKASSIAPSQSASEDSGSDDLERLARINVLLGVEENFITEDSSVNDVTMTKFFYRPAELFNISDKTARDSILAKCPKGLYTTFAGEVFCEGRNASMDDHIEITFADAGDGINRPGLGTPLIAPAKILNTLAELIYEYFVHGVPMTYMDDEMFDIDAIKDQENLVGGIRPFEAVAGAQVDGVYWFREDPVPFPEQIVAFAQWILGEVAQLMSGAYPALFGGDTGSNDTQGGIVIARDQALGRLGLPWRNIKETTAGVIKQCVQMIAEFGKGVIKLGGNDRAVVRVADLKGNVTCTPDTDENFPETWTQKSNRFDKIIEGAATNPFFQKLLDSPSNLKLAQSMSGFKQLKIAMLESWEAQLGEITILYQGSALPNPDLVEMEAKIKTLGVQLQAMQQQVAATLQANPPQPQIDPATGAAVPAQAPAPPELTQLQQTMQQLTTQAQSLPPMVSSYPVSEEDDDDVHALTCLEELRSPRGRAMKNGNKKDQERYANLKLHWQEHQAKVDKKNAAAAQAKQLPPKAPSFSANVKDLPPSEAAAVMNLGGVQSAAGDFEKQDQDEAIAKHPTTLGGAPAK